MVQNVFTEQLTGSTLTLTSANGQSVALTASNTGNLLSGGNQVQSGGGGGGSSVTVYANSSVLPLENLTAGDMAFANNNNTLYLTNGFGWYKIALINQTPSITANLSTVSLGSDGNTALIGYSVSEPEGTPVTVSVANSGLANTSQGNVVLYTSNNTIEINNFAAEGSEWTANVILSVSDGVNIGTSSVTVEVTYGFSETEWFLDYNQGSGSSTNIDPAFGKTTGHTNFSTSTVMGTTNPSDVSMSYDGTKIYVITYGDDNITEMPLSTPFDISTVDGTSKQTINLSGAGETVPRGVHLTPDGLHLYAVGQTLDEVYHWELSTANDITTAGTRETNSSLSILVPHGIWVDNSGTYMFIYDSEATTDDRVARYTMTTPHDISTLSSPQWRTRTQLGGSQTSPGGIFLNPTGTEMYLVGYAANGMEYYHLSTPFDLTTATLIDFVSVNLIGSAGQTNVMGCHIAYNQSLGSNSYIYIVNYGNETVRQSNVALQTTATYPS